MKTTGNTILITGGGSGIGFAIAKAFVNQGNIVIICGRNADKLAQAKQAIPQLHIYTCDITQPEQRQTLLQQIQQQFPTLNLLVNNAGMMNVQNLQQLNAEDQSIEQEMDINFLAPVHLTLAFLPLLKTQPNAAVVIVSSGLVYASDAGTPIYSATKAALHSFSQSLRYQMQDTGIEVFEVLPPGVETALNSEGDFDRISPTVVADAVLRGLQKGSPEIRIGQSKVLHLAARIAPNYIHRMLNQAIAKARTTSG